jgi:hypothetical protein
MASAVTAIATATARATGDERDDARLAGMINVGGGGGGVRLGVLSVTSSSPVGALLAGGLCGAA